MRFIFTHFCTVALYSFLIFYSSSLAAQSLWGTSQGFGDSHGTVYRVDPDGTNVEIVRQFRFEFPGAYPKGRITEGEDGKLYGITSRGGKHDAGVVFEFDPSTKEYNVVFDFVQDQVTPLHGDFVFHNGSLIGLTYPNEQTGNLGSIVQIDLEARTMEELFEFSQDEGGRPLGNLLLGTNGKLYGLVTNSFAGGGIFEFDIHTTSFQLKHAMDQMTSQTVGSILLDGDDIYGFLGDGGANGLGLLFTYNLTYGSHGTLHDFSYLSGANPVGGLTLSKGKIYGVTLKGGDYDEGVLFEFTPGVGYAIRREFQFFSGLDGPLVADESGEHLVGMVLTGGVRDAGFMYGFDLAENRFHFRFDFEESQRPSGVLRNASSGKAYYMIARGPGDPAFEEMLVEVDPSSGVLDRAFKFNSSENGREPSGTLVRANGKIYGTTKFGGKFGMGTLFEVDPTTTAFAVKHHFDDYDGGHPGDLMLAPNGIIYGVGTYSRDGSGIFIRFNPEAGWVGKNWMYYTYASKPNGSLIHADGKIYWTMLEGSSYLYGGLYEYDSETGDTQRLHAFNLPDGRSPLCGVTVGPNGKLYGVTYQSGSGAGVLFEYDLGKRRYTKKHTFDEIAHGGHPTSSLILAKNGKLYGVSHRGNEQFGLGQWIIYEYDPIADVFSKKIEVDFHYNGELPYSKLTLLPDGQLIGVISQGGASKDGMIFRYDPETNVYTPTYSFDRNQRSPIGQLLYHSGKQQQSISFEAIPKQLVTADPVQMVVSASSGLPVTLVSSDPLTASVENNIVTMHRSGSVAIIASQSGNDIYDPAENFVRILHVVSDSPQVTGSIEDQHAIETRPFTFTFDEGLFVDPEDEELFYTATLNSGSPLPPWLTFNSETRTFSGTPPVGSAGDTTVRLIATDGGNETHPVDFVIHVSVIISTEDREILVTNVSPNPTAGTVIIELGNMHVNRFVNIEVLNSLGQPTAVKTNRISHYQYELDLRQMPAQIYLVRVQSGAVSRVYKVVKR